MRYRHVANGYDVVRFYTVKLVFVLQNTWPWSKHCRFVATFFIYWNQPCIAKQRAEPMQLNSIKLYLYFRSSTTHCSKNNWRTFLRVYGIKHRCIVLFSVITFCSVNTIIPTCKSQKQERVAKGIMYKQYHANAANRLICVSC